VRSWKSLHKFLTTVYITLLSLGNFLVVVVLAIFVFALLGMQVCPPRSDLRYQTLAVIRPHNPCAVSIVVLTANHGGVLQVFGGQYQGPPELSPRSHFDNIFAAMQTVFELLIGDDWPSTMYQFVEISGHYAVFYFVGVLMVGNYLYVPPPYPPPYPSGGWG
jgi:hypothetical protein